MRFDNLHEISLFLHPLDMVSVTKSCQELYKYQELPSFQMVRAYLDNQTTFIKRRFSPQIRDIFGGTSAMLRYPMLTWIPQFTGSTLYIDNILPEDVSHPIMIGIDRYNRPFVTLRSRLTGTNHTSKEVVDILFQRYSDDPLTWSNGCCSSGFVKEAGHWLSCGNVRHHHLIENIQRLIKKKGFIEYPSSLYSERDISHRITAYLY